MQDNDSFQTVRACLRCGKPVGAGAPECPHCGVILAKARVTPRRRGRREAGEDHFEPGRRLPLSVAVLLLAASLALGVAGLIWRLDGSFRELADLGAWEEVAGGTAGHLGAEVARWLVAVWLGKALAAAIGIAALVSTLRRHPLLRAFAVVFFVALPAVFTANVAALTLVPDPAVLPEMSRSAHLDLAVAAVAAMLIVPYLALSKRFARAG